MCAIEVTNRIKNIGYEFENINSHIFATKMYLFDNFLEFLTCSFSNVFKKKLFKSVRAYSTTI